MAFLNRTLPDWTFEYILWLLWVKSTMHHRAQTPALASGSPVTARMRLSSQGFQTFFCHWALLHFQGIDRRNKTLICRCINCQVRVVRFYPACLVKMPANPIETLPAYSWVSTPWLRNYSFPLMAGARPSSPAGLAMCSVLRINFSVR